MHLPTNAHWFQRVSILLYSVLVNHKFLSLVVIHRDWDELLWKVINYITHYMLKIVFQLHYKLQAKNEIKIIITNYIFNYIFNY